MFFESIIKVVLKIFGQFFLKIFYLLSFYYFIQSDDYLKENWIEWQVFFQKHHFFLFKSVFYLVCELIESVLIVQGNL